MPYYTGTREKRLRDEKRILLRTALEKKANKMLNGKRREKEVGKQDIFS